MGNCLNNKKYKNIVSKKDKLHIETKKASIAFNIKKNKNIDDNLQKERNSITSHASNLTPLKINLSEIQLDSPKINSESPINNSLDSEEQRKILADKLEQNVNLSLQNRGLISRIFQIGKTSFDMNSSHRSSFIKENKDTEILDKTVEILNKESELLDKTVEILNTNTELLENKELQQVQINFNDEILDNLKKDITNNFTEMKNDLNNAIKDKLKIIQKINDERIKDKFETEYDVKENLEYYLIIYERIDKLNNDLIIQFNDKFENLNTYIIELIKNIKDNNNEKMDALNNNINTLINTLKTDDIPKNKNIFIDTNFDKIKQESTNLSRLSNFLKMYPSDKTKNKLNNLKTIDVYRHTPEKISKKPLFNKYV
jgi:hypothetical protein